MWRAQTRRFVPSAKRCSTDWVVCAFIQPPSVGWFMIEMTIVYLKTGKKAHLLLLDMYGVCVSVFEGRDSILIKHFFFYSSQYWSRLSVYSWASRFYTIGRNNKFILIFSFVSETKYSLVDKFKLRIQTKTFWKLYVRSIYYKCSLHWTLKTSYRTE